MRASRKKRRGGSSGIVSGYPLSDGRHVLTLGYAVDKYISLIMGKPYVLRREHIVSSSLALTSLIV